MTEHVWLIDTSAIIDCKHVVPASDQWELFERLKALVEEGQLYFPRKVADELRQERHHDTPETWALNVRVVVRSAYDPDSQFVSQVMTNAGDVVDPDYEDDPGDPYVLAQALELRSQGFASIVVSNDVVDRGDKISILTACGRFNPPLPHQSLDEFLAGLP